LGGARVGVAGVPGTDTVSTPDVPVPAVPGGTETPGTPDIPGTSGTPGGTDLGTSAPVAGGATTPAVRLPSGRVALASTFAGIVLAAIGAALYFGYWLTRLVTGQRLLLERLDALEQRGPLEADGGGAAAGNGTLVATAAGSMFHRPDCQVVAGRPASELRAVR